MSEEAEQHRDNIRQLRTVVKKRAYCFYVWLSWFRVICPLGLRKVIHRHCEFFVLSRVIHRFFVFFCLLNFLFLRS
ncbi:hypothetical protein DP212_22550 [Escherichia coli]|nr:hypothetical protein [Salmonella enterica subsp. enterica]EAQ6309426.1 hypothetical protein [Salmonella enterica]EEW1503375.1 hypothetical protein [Escherichia coli]EFN8423803.1 hypothetical protein [Escherichia coli O145]PVM26665.1 hypothetical protein C4789_23290 [Salmonella enterica subsp. enterica serovar Montevideo]HBY5124863.1 hypothetical protein [Klebsiella pneumoniae]